MLFSLFSLIFILGPFKETPISPDDGYKKLVCPASGPGNNKHNGTNNGDVRNRK